MLNTINLRKFFLFSGDIICLYLSLLGMIFFGFWKEFDWNIFYSHLLPFSILYLFWLVVFYIFGLYDLNVIRNKIAFYSKILGALLVGLGLGMIFFYLTPFFNITPKINLVLNVLIFGILFLNWRKLFNFLFSFYLLNRIAIIGEDFEIQELSKEIISRPYLGYKLIVLNQNKDLLSQIEKEKIDTLIIPSNLNPNFELTKKFYQCLSARINFIDWTRAYELICQKIPISSIAQTWFLENLREGEREFYDKIKRGVDVIFAGILLILFTFLLPLIVLSIKIEDGGVIFYRQKRIGKDGKKFILYKIRTMIIKAEKNGPQWTIENDSRITRVGKILRRTHLDELPQLINVLKGDISLIGPRPERPEFVKELERKISYYQLRHLIKPGITGWAQIKFRYGRSIIDSQEKFQYDLYYLKNRSLALDLGILLKTLQFFFKKE